MSAHGCEWVVETQGVETAFFATGGRAEVAARRLAERFAGLGQTKKLRIVLSDGSEVGAFVCEATHVGPKWRRIA